MASIVNILRNSGQMAYDNTTSGLTATAIKGAIDETVGRLATAEGNITTLQSSSSTLTTTVAALNTLSGVAVDATDLGTFTGTVIPDSTTVKAALQALETAHEALSGVQMEFQDSVLDYVVDNTAVPASESLGDRYILSHDGGTPNAAYDGAAAGDIVEFDGTVWVASTPTVGTFVSADDESNVLYYYGGTWSTKAFENTTASTGLVKVGTDIRIADASANAFSFTSGVGAVLVDDTTIEITTNALNLKDAGVTEAKLATNAVTNAKIADDSVTGAKLGADVTGDTGAGFIGFDNNNGSYIGAATNAQDAIDELDSTFDNVANIIGVPQADDANLMGTYTGSTISDNQSAKQNIQEIETELESVESRVTTLESSAAAGGWTVVTGPTTMVNTGKYAVDSTSSAITVTLPATPSAGDSVIVFDAGNNSETNNITVARNGENIRSVADDLSFDTVNSASVTMVYINSSIGWSVSAI